MNRQETLSKALDAVNRRPKAYGPPEQNFDRIAQRWNVHLWNRFGIALGEEGEGFDATDVAIMCADIKLARLEETPDHEDSWIDLAGYAACGAEVSTRQTIEAEVAGTGGAIDQSGNTWWRNETFGMDAGVPPTAEPVGEPTLVDRWWSEQEKKRAAEVEAKRQAELEAAVRRLSAIGEENAKRFAVDPELPKATWQKNADVAAQAAVEGKAYELCIGDQVECTEPFAHVHGHIIGADWSDNVIRAVIQCDVCVYSWKVPLDCVVKIDKKAST